MANHSRVAVDREEVMMAVMTAGVDEERVLDAPLVVRERLEAFGVEVLAGAMNRPVQVRNGGLYLRGLLEHGARKSLEPLVERLGGDADYQSLQQFLADSPWDPAAVVRGDNTVLVEPPSLLADKLPSAGVEESPLRMMYRDSTTYLEMKR